MYTNKTKQNNSFTTSQGQAGVTIPVNTSTEKNSVTQKRNQEEIIVLQ